jgi:protein-S-isoprenylcysteine O-methyltransferase Ste14
MARRPLLVRALGGLVFLHTCVALLVFGGAGTIRWVEAWVFFAIFLGINLGTTLDLYVRDPKLLERRSSGGFAAEKIPRQKVIQAAATGAFLACFLIPALDHRFHGSSVPLVAVVVGDVLVAAGQLIVSRTFRENTYASATVELAEQQRVIDTGPYRLVRHPMYAGGIVFAIGLPLALGSLRGLVGVVLLTLSIVWRLQNEEAFLAQNLPGYDAYRRRTRHRLVPGVW